MREKSPNQYLPSLKARLSIGLFNLAGRFALNRFEKRIKDAAKANQETLAQILKLNENTLFGRQHRFEAIRASETVVADYKKAVPLARFGDLASYIDRIAQGQSNILTCDEVDILAGSSGTTDAPKQLPNTKRARGKFMFFVPLVQQGVLNREVPGVSVPQRGINLMSLYTPAVGQDSTVPVSSAINAGANDIRKQIPILWCSPEAVFALEHLPTVHYLHALFGLIHRDTLYISAIFLPHLIAWFSMIEKHQEQLFQDIETGSLSDHLKLTEDERVAIQAHLLPDPVRATELRAEFAKGFQDIVRRIWPDLKYCTAITTGSFAIHLPRLKWLAGDRIPVYSFCHGSSEAFVGINLRVDQSDYVLACGSAFFEFIPLAETSEDQPDTVSIDEVEVGQEYEIVLTNFAGLYRYRLDDIVRITGLNGTAPMFEFLYRQGAILNLVGEKMTEYHTAKALTTCIDQWLGSKGHLQDFSVAAETARGVSSYTFYAELNPGVRPNEDTMKDVAANLDVELCNANTYYWTNGRETQRLGPVTIKFVEPGTFAALSILQDRRTGGAVTSQVKTPRIIKRDDQLHLLEKAVVVSTTGQTSPSSILIVSDSLTNDLEEH